MTRIENGRRSSKTEMTEVEAAKVLQNYFRKHQKQREDSGLNLSSSTRWTEALKHQRRKSVLKQSSPLGKNDSHARWQRAGFFASELVNQSAAGPSTTSPPRKSFSSQSSTPTIYKQKAMDPRYWLEMVDVKHRYGSNLKVYHAHWNEHYHGDQNFFYWLDHGDGKDLDLEDSPRERLESEKIIYLNAEQRLNYLVRIDEGGKLVWAKDGRYVDTARGRHKDLGNGLGIVDATDEEFKNAQMRGEIPSSSSSSLSSVASSILSEHAHHYARPGKQTNVKSKLKSHFHPNSIIDTLLRKTLNVNTWIFVADRFGNLYVGIKQTGRFQHSSFLGGGQVLAAGLLRANNGQLTQLSPLSGHYRAGSDQFKSFLTILEHEWRCDMSKVSVSRSLMIIGALENYAKLTQKKADLKSKLQNLFHWHHHDQAAGNETESTRPAHKNVVERDSNRHEEERIKLKGVHEETKRANEIVSRAGEFEREQISGRLNGKKLLSNIELHPLPYENKQNEEMNDDEKIERGAAVRVFIGFT